MNILITLCGRAGSKGVRNKNINEFLGFPLIFYTVSAAALFKNDNPEYSVDVSVSSDSLELLGIVDKFTWIQSIVRPDELAQDHSAKVPAIRHACEYMEEAFSKVYDFVIDLDITAPMRMVSDIDGVLATAFRHPEYDTVMSVVPARRNPWFNMVKSTDKGVVRIEESNFTARQQAPQVYDCNASIYVYRRDSLISTLKNSPFDGVCGIFNMMDTAVLDIDSKEDFQLMSIIAKYFYATHDGFKRVYSYCSQL